MNIANLFWQACDKEPDGNVAIATESCIRTYGELRERVTRLTTALSQRGIGRGDRVAVLGRNCPEYIEIFWACVSVGATVVTLNFRLTPRELAPMCAYSEPKAYFCATEFLSKITVAEPHLALKDLICWGAGSEQLRDDSPAKMFGAQSFEDIAAGVTQTQRVLAPVDGDAYYSIIFTGGTSGAPKAVGRSHRNILAMLLLTAGNDLLGSRRTLIGCTPFFHIAGQIAFFSVALGGTVVLLEGSFSGVRFLQLVERFKVSAAFVVPAMLIEIAQIHDTHRFNTASLRELRSGGAPLPLDVAQRLTRRFPELRFGNGGGSTEAGTMGFGWWDDLSTRTFGCIGRPPIGQEIRIIDEEGNECPNGTIGEIAVRGAQVASGYWKDRARTAASFVAGWLHGGDLGWIDEGGRIYLVDRKSDLIISGGENIYARELEEALFRIARVNDVAVIGVPDARWGEVPMAILVTTDGKDEVEDIKVALAGTVASYKRPQYYRVLAALPRTAVGKVDKNSLRAMLKA